MVMVAGVKVYELADADFSNTPSPLTKDARKRVEQLVARWPDEVASAWYSRSVFDDGEPDDEELMVALYDGRGHCYFKEVTTDLWKRSTHWRVEGAPSDPSGFKAGLLD